MGEREGRALGGGEPAPRHPVRARDARDLPGAAAVARGRLSRASLLVAIPAAAAALAGWRLAAQNPRETLFRADAAGIAAAVVLAAFSLGAPRGVAMRLVAAAALLAVAHAGVAGVLGRPASGALALLLLVLGTCAGAAGLAALGRACACPPAAAGAVAAAVLLTACGGLWWADRFAERLPLEARPAARQAVLTLDPTTAAAYGCADLDRLHLPDVYDQTTIATVTPPTPLETGAWWGGLGLLAAAASLGIRPRTAVPPGA